MAIDNLSQRISELSERLEELQIKCVSDPANAPEVLSDALESLQASIEELSVADEELMQQNEALMRAQSELQESESILHSFFDSPGAMRGIVEVIADDEVRHIVDNEVTAGFLGLTPEAMRGKLSSELGEPQEILRVWVSHYRQSQLTGKPVSFEYQDKRGDNEAWLSVTVNRLGATSERTQRFSYIVNDITERKQAERSLHENEHRLQQAQELLESVTKGTDVIIAAIDTNFCYTLFNKAYQEEVKRLSGMDIHVGASIVETFAHQPEQQKIVVEQWSEVLEGKSTNKMLEFGDPGLYRRLYNVLHTPIRDAEGKIVGAGEVAYDVTEKVRSAEALRESEEKLSALYASMVEGIALHEIVYDKAENPVDYVIIDVNPSFEKITGLSRDKALGQRASALYGTGAAPFLDIYSRVASSGKPESFETYFEPMRKHFNISVFSPARGKFATVFSDITEHKRQEEKIAKLTRLYAVLSRVNETIVRIHDVNSLYIEVCRIVAEVAGFPLVWIGHVQQHLVVPVAWSGPAADYLKDIKVEVQGEFSKGPTGTCIRENRAVVNDDFATNPTTLPWRESALRCGFHASAAFPLHRQGRAIGAFTFYAYEPNAFDPDQVELLESLSSDISYALDALDQEQLRIRAEEDLRETRDYLENLIDYANAPIIVWDTAFKIVRFNHAFERLTGLRAAEAIGEPLNMLFPESSQVESLEHIHNAMYGEQWDAVEIPILRTDGSVRIVLWNSANIHDKDGKKVATTIAQGQDITERKKAEKALKKAHEELEQRVKERTAELSDAKENLEVINEELQVEISEHEKTEKELMAAKEAAEAAVEAKAAFLANMSHELRTPLNAVIGFSSLLLDDNLTQDQKENIERIRNGGEALLSIISDILEFSRAEKEKVKLELQPFSLKHCIEESLGMVAVQANDKGLNLAYTMSYGMPDTIIGDQGRLRQVLVNLLSNAVKFTDEGDISVSISSKAIVGNKRNITFAVKDTGIGMPQDKMDRLFQPFSQLEYVISRKRDGAGLGLAICKEIVELMGGEIRAESEEGKGSTFRFTIPVETIPGKQLDLGEKDKAAVYENLAAQKPLSILVAEDNPSNQKVLVEMLKRLGYRADAVADGVEVLQALKIRPYDLVFMDIKMPEMDGLTATKEIRKLWPDKGPNVVAITAFSMDGDRELCLEAGMDGYIAKPVKLGELAEILMKYVPKT